MPLSKPSIPREYWALSAIILLSAFLVSPGFFSIDEAIYYLGARALAEGSSLGINNNGLEQFHSESLKLRFLVDGPQGLTPQYPAGTALLAAPLLPILGPRAFILMNALAAVLTLFTVRKICLNQFKEEWIARIALALLVAGTFWAEYAVGIWPHALSTFFAVQAYWLALRHLESKDKSYALLSGLFAGLGLLFRLDAVLAVPAIGLILVLFSARFLRSSFWFGLGVLPSIALLSWLNMLKFGPPNPFSYGQARGNVDIMTHIPALIALCAGFALLILWRKGGWPLNKKVVIASLAAAGIALLVIPATNAWLFRFGHGFLALVVDARNIEDHRIAVQRGPGNTMILWGQVKKSLGQSMPWAGLTAILLTSGVPKGEQRFTATLLIFIAVMTLPYILLTWHGGGGSNMRYFLPVLPALCILCAKLLSDLWSTVPKAITFVAAGAWVALGLCLAWTLLHPSRFAGVQQILSTYILLVTALTAASAGIDWRLRQAARSVAIMMFAAGFLMSASFAVSDFTRAAQRRAENDSGRSALARLPANSLVIAYPEWVGDRVPGNGTILSIRNEETRQIDPQLIIDAVDAGYRVFVVSLEFNALRDVPPGFEAVLTDHDSPNGRMIELRRMPAVRP